jgi:hypothetical protein
MERLIDKICDNNETNTIFNIQKINKIKNVEINNDNNKKLFIYKNYGIQIKDSTKFIITFFKIVDDTNLIKLLELNNVKIKISNQLISMFKYNDIWTYTLYDETKQDLIEYFSKKFNIKIMKNIEE